MLFIIKQIAMIKYVQIGNITTNNFSPKLHCFILKHKHILLIHEYISANESLVANQ